MFKEAIKLIDSLFFSDFFGTIKLKLTFEEKINFVKKVLSKRPDTPMSTHLLSMRKHLINYKEKIMLNKMIKAYFKGLTKDYKARNLKSMLSDMELTLGDGKIIKEKLNREWKTKQKI